VSFAAVIAGGSLPADPAAALGVPPRSDVSDNDVVLLVDLHRLDHRRPVDTEHATPYVGTEHAASSVCLVLNL
jgi:hypothetical protein